MLPRLGAGGCRAAGAAVVPAGRQAEADGFGARGPAERKESALPVTFHATSPSLVPMGRAEPPCAQERIMNRSAPTWTGTGMLAPAPRATAYRLHVEIRGPNGPRTFLLEGSSPISLGRHQQSDIVLD